MNLCKYSFKIFMQLLFVFCLAYNLKIPFLIIIYATLLSLELP